MQIGYKMLLFYKIDLRAETELDSNIKIIMYIKTKSNSLNLMFKKQNRSFPLLR